MVGELLTYIIREGYWVEAALWSSLGQGVPDRVWTEAPKCECECVWHICPCSMERPVWLEQGWEVGATFGGAYGHSDRLRFYSTESGKTAESLFGFFFLLEHFKHIKSVLSPVSTLSNMWPVLGFLFFQSLYLPILDYLNPYLGSFESIPMFRMYLYSISTSKKLWWCLKILTVSQYQLPICVYLSVVSERSFLKIIVLLGHLAGSVS